MPSRIPHIRVSEDGVRIRRKLEKCADEYWVVEQDERFGVLIAADGDQYAVIEGKNAVLIRADVVDLLIDTKMMHEQLMREGRQIQKKQKKQNKSVKLDRGKVFALWEGNWTVKQITDEMVLDGCKTTEDQIRRVLEVEYGRDESGGIRHPETRR